MTGRSPMPGQAGAVEQHYCPDEVAERLRLTPKTLANWRSLGKGLPFRLFGGKPRYPADLLRAWIDEQELQGDDVEAA